MCNVYVVCVGSVHSPYLPLPIEGKATDLSFFSSASAKQFFTVLSSRSSHFSEPQPGLLQWMTYLAGRPKPADSTAEEWQRKVACTVYQHIFNKPMYYSWNTVYFKNDRSVPGFTIRPFLFRSKLNLLGHNTTTLELTDVHPRIETIEFKGLSNKTLQHWALTYDLHTTEI